MLECEAEGRHHSFDEAIDVTRRYAKILHGTLEVDLRVVDTTEDDVTA